METVHLMAGAGLGSLCCKESLNDLKLRTNQESSRWVIFVMVLAVIRRWYVFFCGGEGRVFRYRD